MHLPTKSAFFGVLLGTVLCSCGAGQSDSPAKPNLEVGTMSSTPRPAESEGQVEVLNTGQLDAGPFAVEMWIGNGWLEPEPGDVGDLSFEVEGLAVGESVQLEGSVSGDQCLVRVYLDSQEEVDESDETDNSGEVGGCGR